MLRSVIAYGIAVAALLTAVAARWLLDPILGDSVPFITLFGAVAVAVWIGGVGPAVLVAVLGYLTCAYLFMEPRRALGLDDRNLVALGAFLFTCAFIIGFCEAMRRARRRAEIEEATLRVTFASMGDAVLSTDGEARITSLNPVAEFLTGWRHDDAIGQPLETVFRIVNEQTREAVENPARRALRDGVVVALASHTLLIRKDGTECPIDDRAAPIRDAHRRIIGCVLTFRDISERRSIERRLAERLSASYFLASIVRSSQDAIISKTLDGTILSWNAAAERMFGHTAAEAIGRHISLLIPPDRMSEEERIIAQLRTGGRVEHFDTVRLRRNGESIHVSLTISPIEDEAGHIIGASKIVRDVSDRIRTDAALRSRNERLRLLSDAADILLSTQDADSMLRQLLDRIGPYLALDAYLHYLADESGGSLRLASCDGVPQEAVPTLGRLDIGQSVCGAVALRKKPIHATRIQQSDELMVQQIKSFGIRVYACYPLMSDQRLLGTLSFASRTRDEFEPEELVFLDTICHYVSAAYERLRLMDKLREADQRKDEFLATLAHELRNPLAPLANALEIMNRADGDTAVLRQAQQTMDRQLAQLVRLVDDLLDVSRITRNMVALRRQRVPLASILHHAVEMCRPLADASGVMVNVEISPESIVLDADALRLTQVFSNLLNNACRYTPRGGLIEVRAERVGSQARISIKDTGAGIAADKLRWIFDMFSQVDGSSEQHGGLGIGLTLARRLTELHGGTLEAFSEGLGRGSEFVVQLPALARDLPAAGRDTETERPRGGPNRRVLVIDDNPDGAASLAMLLGIWGHEAHVAYSGQEAIELAGSLRPEIVLLDIGLPGLSGYDTCRRMREEVWGQDMTIVAVTGWGTESDRSRSSDAGFDHHLVKPVDFAALSAVLAASRSGKRSTARQCPRGQAFT